MSFPHTIKQSVLILSTPEDSFRSHRLRTSPPSPRRVLSPPHFRGQSRVSLRFGPPAVDRGFPHPSSGSISLLERLTELSEVIFVEALLRSLVISDWAHSAAFLPSGGGEGGRTAPAPSLKDCPNHLITQLVLILRRPKGFPKVTLLMLQKTPLSLFLCLSTLRTFQGF